MEQLGESHQILFLDRAFCPGTIQKNIEFIVKLNRPYVKLVVVTQNYNTTKLNETMYPFSVNYLLVCLKRCL